MYNADKNELCMMGYALLEAVALCIQAMCGDASILLYDKEYPSIPSNFFLLLYLSELSDCKKYPFNRNGQTFVVTLQASARILQVGVMEIEILHNTFS